MRLVLQKEELNGLGGTVDGFTLDVLLKQERIDLGVDSAVVDTSLAQMQRALD